MKGYGLASVRFIRQMIGLSESITFVVGEIVYARHMIGRVFGRDGKIGFGRALNDTKTS